MLNCPAIALIGDNKGIVPLSAVTVSRAIPVIPVDASSNPVLGSPAKCRYAKTV